MITFKTIWTEDGFTPDHDGIRHTCFNRDATAHADLFAFIDALYPNTYRLEPSLEEAKAEKYAAIDARTRELLSNGFSYDGHIYSLSEAAQLRATGCLAAISLMSFPILWNSQDDSYVLEIPDATTFQSFAGTMLYYLKNVIDGGTALKTQVRNSTTVEAVLAIADPR